ncbi:MAG: AbrB/MazE/SpoVT family DNA-binding domain-containing protein [Rhodocyclaceae bacterium]|nr:AbrB/MazE/SpoVT family DNA-binding domain-containing protein [Rhodocyclaceae bacterium]MCA3026395.1 AbrB/MazE/SpoVT family DNA-binding domain-containing protein [Rhodocyclaceae bacterium]MCA3032016.1 AbrB/MazE/SpoVT family DNA-binding domain-containing protein [Rhodocyclaceae bacterium]MCA3037711.1 AbrB/MazE/SpoVT family DNA-binding domain-containing protein [Rhodocyclaceae bacterium]MCA3040750.1 AbrB/MazE/SpoVT family DNA-binding domain-containing protein [Rhodocyclaceae bacterium]
MSTTITVKGQVTIPKQIRDSLGLVPGSKVEFTLNERGEYIVLPAGPPKKGGKAGSHGSNLVKSRFDAVRGTASMSGMSTDEYMNLIRSYDQDAADPGLKRK